MSRVLWYSGVRYAKLGYGSMFIALLKWYDSVWCGLEKFVWYGMVWYEVVSSGVLYDQDQPQALHVLLSHFRH